MSLDLKGRLIVIEGIDQSGKDTQTRLLVRRLRWEGYQTEKLSYPVYTSYSGREIAGFLEGHRSYPFQALYMLYSMNRWESLATLTGALAKSDYVIIDRYYPSNLAYGIARGLDEKWLLNLDHGLPEPDRVILLDTAVKVSFTRKSSGRDIHERDREFLQRVRRIYQQLARRRHWIIVKGDRSLQDVSDDIWRGLQITRSRRSTRSRAA